MKNWLAMVIGLSLILYTACQISLLYCFPVSSPKVLLKTPWFVHQFTKEKRMKRLHISTSSRLFLHAPWSYSKAGHENFASNLFFLVCFSQEIIHSKETASILAVHYHILKHHFPSQANKITRLKAWLCIT